MLNTRVPTFDRALSASAAAPAARSSGHAWRGLLIALIVLGHNRLFPASFPSAYRLIYNFHVEAFLIIPFLRRTDRTRPTRVLYPLRAYFRPFFIFVSGYAAIFALSGLPEAPGSAGAALVRWAAAVAVANSTVLDWATGFKMFWFLPVFILLSTLRPLMEQARGVWLAAAFVVALALHLAVGLLHATIVAWLPWGLPVIGYMLFPCLCALALARSGIVESVSLRLSAGVFAATVVACAAGGFWINLSDFKVYDVRTPAALLTTDACMIVASLVFYRLDGFVRAALLDALGRYSLQIYLIHGIIGYALVRFAGRHHDLAGDVARLALTYAATLALSYVAARALMASRAGAWIFNVRPARG